VIVAKTLNGAVELSQCRSSVPCYAAPGFVSP
jgi:hypothetical protein